MRRIVVETDAANKFITDIESLAAKNNLEVEINMNDLEVYIGFAPLLKAEIADIDIPEPPAKPKSKGGRPKGGPRNNKISIQEFKAAVDSLGKGTLAQNLVKAIDITGLSKSFLSRLYYSQEDGEMIDDRCYGLLKKLMHPGDEDPDVKKNSIMIRRVARAKNTDDPYIIANTIMGSVNMQNQTTFMDVGEIIAFIKKHGTR